MIPEWLSQHAGVLRFFSGAGYTLLWLLFLQLMYLKFRSKRRPRLLINLDKKKGLDSLCIISNMGAEPVYIEYIVAELETSQGILIQDVTALDQAYDGSAAEGEPGSLTQITRQGPLASGHFLHIGSFGKLAVRLARANGLDMHGHRPCDAWQIHSLTLRLIVTHGPESQLVGAERRFDLVDNGKDYLPIPQARGAKQLTSRSQRRQLQKLARLFAERDHSRA